MLNDPILFPRPSSAQLGVIQLAVSTTSIGGLIRLPRVNQDGEGAKYRFVESGGENTFTLTILRSETKENKPFLTRRTVIRLDRKKVNSTTGLPVTASAYIVLAQPMGPDFDEADVIELAQSLGAFVLLGQVNGDSEVLAVTDGSIDRIIAGES